MADNPHSDSQNLKIHDLEIKEQTITPEELARDYVDMKQVGQLLQNSSERTAYRIFTKVKTKYNFVPDFVSVNVSGAIKKLYRKTDILKVADLMSKIVPVTVFRTEFVKDNTVVSDSIGRAGAEHLSEPLTPGREVAESTKSVLAEFRSGLQAMTNLSSEIKDINDHLKRNADKVAAVFEKIVEQGIDLKERYFEDKQKRFELEQKRLELDQRQIEINQKNAEALAQLSRKPARKINPGVWLLISVVFTAVLVVIAAYFFQKSAQEMSRNFVFQLSNVQAHNQEQIKAMKQEVEALKNPKAITKENTDLKKAEGR